MLANSGTIGKYYVAVKPQTNDIHPVHKEGCPFMPDDCKRIYLGLFTSGNEAGIEGKKYFNNSHGCRFCAKESFSGETALNHKVNAEPALSSMLSFMN